MSEFELIKSSLAKLVKGEAIKLWLAAISFTLGIYILGQKFAPGNVFTVRQPVLIPLVILIYSTWLFVFLQTIGSLMEVGRSLLEGRDPKPRKSIILLLGLLGGFLLTANQKNHVDGSVDLLTFAVGSGVAWFILGFGLLTSKMK